MRKWKAARTSSLASSITVLLCGCADANRPAPSPLADDQACPAWVQWDLHSNAVTPDPGCLNRHNLAKTAAQPSDLKTGRAIGPADGARETLGVTAYEQGKVKPFSSEQSMGPTVIVPGGTSGTR
jgi:type IV pilus biogenesis protein CpaD/CtpE